MKKPFKSYFSYTMFVVFSVDLLATAGDITMTWSSPMYPKLYSNDTTVNPLGRPITEDEDGWLSSLINIGAMVGPIPFSFISARFGRKISLITSAIPHVVAYLTLAFASNIYLYYFARILGGLAVGGSYTILPMYIAEVAETSNRGMYSVSLGFFWCIGDCLPFIVGPFVSVKIFHFVLVSIPLLFIISFSIIGVETPYYLVGKKKVKEAEKVLMKLRSGSKHDVVDEMILIEKTIASEEQGKVMDILKSPGLRKALFIAVMLQAFQQLTGINAVSAHQQTIIEESGTNLSAEMGSVVIGISILIFSLVTPFTVDKYGRRPLLIISSLGDTLVLILMGTYFYANEHDWDTSSFQWFPLPGLLLFTFFFQVGMSTLPWTISSELFPKNAKNVSSSVTCATCWIASFLVTKFYIDMVRTMGSSGTFWVYAGLCLLSAILTATLVPETRQKTFLEIQKKLNKY